MRKKTILRSFGLLILLSGILAGCSQTTSSLSNPSELPPTDQFELVRKAADNYLAGNFVSPISPEELYKEYVQEKNSQYLLIDIRASEDFIAGNIRGSINIPYAQTVSLKKLESLPKDKTLVVIDYNGHWAAQTAATWNMLGFSAVPLKYGIQSWTKEEAPAGYEIFPEKPLNNPLVTTENALNDYLLPELKMSQAKSEEIIRILAGTYLDRNYKGFITAEDLMTIITDSNTVDEYYLVDIRSPEHYQRGHIAGSVNIPLTELGKVKMLKRLPQDKKIVLVGYDGMDGSQGSRILVTLGYNAVSLKYGLSYWSGDEKVTGTGPIQSLVQDEYELTPLNYAKPSTGAAGCG